MVTISVLVIFTKRYLWSLQKNRHISLIDIKIYSFPCENVTNVKICLLIKLQDKFLELYSKVSKPYAKCISQYFILQKNKKFRGLSLDTNLGVSYACQYQIRVQHWYFINFWVSRLHSSLVIFMGYVSCSDCIYV